MFSAAITKRCTKCGVEKALEAFSPHQTGVHGRQSHCKVCMATYVRERRQANPEKGREYMRKYCAANPEKEKERYRKYRAANPDKLRESKQPTLIS